MYNFLIRLGPTARKASTVLRKKKKLHFNVQIANTLIPVNRGVAFFPFSSGEVHIYVEIEFVLECERVPVKSLHLDDAGVSEKGEV